MRIDIDPPLPPLPSMPPPPVSPSRAPDAKSRTRSMSAALAGASIGTNVRATGWYPAGVLTQGRVSALYAPLGVAVACAGRPGARATAIPPSTAAAIRVAFPGPEQRRVIPSKKGAHPSGVERPTPRRGSGSDAARRLGSHVEDGATTASGFGVFADAPTGTSGFAAGTIWGGVDKDGSGANWPPFGFPAGTRRNERATRGS